MIQSTNSATHTVTHHILILKVELSSSYPTGSIRVCIARVDKGWLQYTSVKLLQKVLLVIGFTLHIDKCLGGVLHITVQYVQGRQLASRLGMREKL